MADELNSDENSQSQNNDDNKNLDERQIVVFKLGDEEFGVNITEVHEIIRMESITKMPNTAEYIEGVINLRGGIIVVINLAMKLGLIKKDIDKNTRIIVIDIKDSTVGMVVDSATEVLRISGENIKPAPSIVTQKIDASYIEGVGILGERLLILLDLAKVLDGGELDEISSAKKTAPDGVEETKAKSEMPPKNDSVDSVKNESSVESSTVDENSAEKSND